MREKEKKLLLLHITSNVETKMRLVNEIQESRRKNIGKIAKFLCKLAEFSVEIDVT